MADTSDASLPEKSRKISTGLYEIPIIGYIAQSSLLSNLELRHTQRVGGFHVRHLYVWAFLLGCLGLLTAALTIGTLVHVSEPPKIDPHEQFCFLQEAAPPEVSQIVSPEPTGPGGQLMCPQYYKLQGSDPESTPPIVIGFFVVLALGIEGAVVCAAVLHLRAGLLEKKVRDAIDSAHEAAIYPSDGIVWTSLQQGLAKQARDAGWGTIDSIGEKEVWEHFMTALTEHTNLGKQLDLPMSDYLAKTADLAQKYETSDEPYTKLIERSFAKLSELHAITLFPMIRSDILAMRNRQADVSPAPVIAQELESEAEHQEVLAIIAATEQLVC